MSNWGKFVGEQTHATKLKADTALLDRSMKTKKEAFGTEVFDMVVMEAEVVTGLKAVMSSAADKEIAAKIDAAKQDISVPINKKEMKQREIEYVLFLVYVLYSIYIFRISTTTTHIW
jgi:hypothetical protein